MPVKDEKPGATQPTPTPPAASAGSALPPMPATTPAPSPTSTPGLRMRRWIINIVALLAAWLCAWLYYRDSLIHPATDDAYIQADFVKVAPQVSGPAVAINVADNQLVKRGDLLIQIDPRPFQLAVQSAQVALDQAADDVRALEQAVAAAQSQVNNAQAALTLAQQTRDRVVTLSRGGAFSKQDLDNANARFAQTSAELAVASSNLAQARETLGEPGINNTRIRSARTALESAKLNLSYTSIHAPVDGYVVSFYLTPGNYLVAGQGVFAIVDDATWRATAHVQETQLRYVKRGQQVDVLVKAYPGKHFRGVVQGIGRGIFDKDNQDTSDLLPNISPTLDWVRLAQRFPVRIVFLERDDNFPLRIAQSAYVVIDTQSELVPVPPPKDQNLDFTMPSVTMPPVSGIPTNAPVPPSMK